jgi:polyphosphate kinase
LIDKEIKNAKRGKEALIRIKLNNLEEPYMIDLLYKASKAGVRVEMIVRSICCLIPGVINQSEHITVKRIVDRYLEHTRLFIFGTGEDAVVVMGSADWMIRNLRHRIEVCTPILDADCRRELLDYFEMQWKDNDKAVKLSSDMENQKIADDNTDVFNAQKTIYKYLQKRA